MQRSNLGRQSNIDKETEWKGAEDVEGVGYRMVGVLGKWGMELMKCPSRVAPSAPCYRVQILS